MPVGTVCDKLDTSRVYFLSSKDTVYTQSEKWDISSMIKRTNVIQMYIFSSPIQNI